MRASAPYAFLSQDGRRIAYIAGARLLFISAANGRTRSETLPHEASQAAFSPDAHYITAANHEILSLFRVDGGPTLLGQTSLPAKPYRLATSEDGTSIAAFVYNDEEGVVGLWEGQELTPILGKNGHSLGDVLPDAVRLDAPHKRFLIWGQQGANAFSGAGTPYIRLFDYSSGKLREVWAGDSLAFEPNGVVMPLTAATFAVYDRDRLAVFKTASPENPEVSYRFEAMEKLVCSPDGKRIAWLWNTSEASRVTYHLASLRLGVDERPDVISFDHMGAFEKFAISNSGELTLIYGKQPKHLHTFQSKDGQLVSTGQIDVNA